MNSLRLRIALAMAVLGIVATAAVGAVSYRSTSARLVDEVDRSITEATSLLVNRNASDRLNVPSRGLLGVYSVRLFNRRAEQVSSSFDDEVVLTDAARAVIGFDGGFDAANLTVNGERFRVHTVGAERGGIQVARSLGETDRVLDDLRRRTVFLVFVVAAVAAALGWFIASGVAAPLRRLTSAAERVESSGDLDVDADVELVVAEGRADEVGRLGAAFQSMLVALRRSRSEQQRLVQDAGHELRTPLTSLRTNLAVLRRHPDMNTDMQERVLDDLDGEVGELTDLVNELVSVASGELLDQPPQPVDLAAVATEAAQRFARRRDREIRIEIIAPATVSAPPAALDRAISNLVQNATKFDATGGPVDVIVDGGTVSVLDRGPGITDADLPYVFDRFHRAVTARTMPGSGLGLAIVRDVVERCGGTVHASQRQGGGAVVGFTLPTT